MFGRPFRGGYAVHASAAPAGRPGPRGFNADADQASGQAALVFVAGGEKRGMRAAEAHRNAEALARSDDDVGAPFARRHQHGHREQVGRRDDQRALGVHPGGELAIVAHVAVGSWVLQQGREAVGAGRRLGRSDGNGNPQRPGPRAQNVDRLRQHVGGHVHRRRRLLADAPTQRHRLGCGSRLVKHRRIGDRHRGKVADHRLEIDQRFEPALRDFRLVRRVGRVPGGILRARCAG